MSDAEITPSDRESTADAGQEPTPGHRKRTGLGTMAYRYLRDTPVRRLLPLATPRPSTAVMGVALVVLWWLFPVEEFEQTLGDAPPPPTTVTVTEPPPETTSPAAPQTPAPTTEHTTEQSPVESEPVPEPIPTGWSTPTPTWTGETVPQQQAPQQTPPSQQTPTPTPTPTQQPRQSPQQAPQQTRQPGLWDLFGVEAPPA